MSKNALYFLFYILMGLSLVNCSDASFNGNDSDATFPSEQTFTEEGNDPLDETPVPDISPPDMKPPLAEETVVYQTSIINSGLSFEKVHVEINIEPSNAPILLFIHLQQPTVIHLKGEVSSVDAVFLTANTNAYDLPSSEVLLPDNSTFPSSLTATGYFPVYGAGSNLNGLLGDTAVTLWEQGVVVSEFSKLLGARKCFDLIFDTDIAPPKEFNLGWSSGQNCIY